MTQRSAGPAGSDGTTSPTPSSGGNGAAAAGSARAGRNPVLDQAQLDLLRRYGSEQDVAAGDVLFADGDETYDLIVMLAGEGLQATGTAVADPPRGDT